MRAVENTQMTPSVEMCFIITCNFFLLSCDVLIFSENLRAATMSVLKAALQPMASNVKISWDVDCEGKKVENICTIPSAIPPLFAGTYLTAFGLIPAGKISEFYCLRNQFWRPYTTLGRYGFQG